MEKLSGAISGRAFFAKNPAKGVTATDATPFWKSQVMKSGCLDNAANSDALEPVARATRKTVFFVSNCREIFLSEFPLQKGYFSRLSSTNDRSHGGAKVVVLGRASFIAATILERVFLSLSEIFPYSSRTELIAALWTPRVHGLRPSLNRVTK